MKLKPPSKYIGRLGLVFCGLTLCVVPSHADILFDYTDFSNTAGLTLVGNTATTTSGDGTVLRLTQSSGNESGAAYSTSPVTLGSDDTFSTTFQFRFTDPAGWDPADGITFVLAASPTGLGGNGEGIGYEGVLNSIAVEFDTYNNTFNDPNSGDQNSSNHVAIDTDGSLTNTDLTNVYNNPSCGFTTGGNPNQSSYVAPGCMSNGDLWTATISYDGSDLTVIVQDGTSSAFTAINDYPIDLASYLGTNTAYVGFTSGTGAGMENHDIVDWQFADTALASTPEPGSLTLLAFGLTGLGWIRRRRNKLRTADAVD